MTEYDTYAFDVAVQPLMKWLETRLKQGKRDVVDALARRMIADRRLPRQASKSMYLAQLRSKKYSSEDLTVFETAWSQMREESE